MEILSEVRDGIATITLNRPAALNALSLDMVLALHAKLREWAGNPQVKAVVIRGAGEKAFCAGGDIRALHQSFTTGGTLHDEFFAPEYELDYFIHRYPKPCICLMDGITMGGGMGIAQGAQVRVVTDKTRIAMPEVGIGLIPDVGASYFLSRLPGAIGLYLALTGNQVRAADALYAGLADVYLPADALARVDEVLRQVQWGDESRADVSNVFRSLGTTRLPDAPVAAVRPAIDRHFGHANVAGVLQSLRSETSPEYSAWAQQTLATIATRSPLTVAVAQRQLQRGKTLSLAECFRMELGLVRHCFERGDFIEGVRALIVDKDNNPRWRHGDTEAVPETDIDAFFQDPWSGRIHPLAGLEQMAL
jgi:enoyl-CoA hydratase/carnithine racemase